jgi:hypothetical protein
MPAGEEVTVPLPPPVLVTVRSRVPTSKVAVHARLALKVTAPSEQSASPLQPVKAEPESGFALRVTVVPWG